jgi:hypothetical protein
MAALGALDGYHLRFATGQPRRHHTQAAKLRISGVENDPSAGLDEGQAPLGGGGRRGERAGHSRPVGVAARPGRVLLGPGTDDLCVRELGGGGAQKRAFLPVRLEQVDPEFRVDGRERDPGRAAARAYVDDRPSLDQRSRGECALDVDTPGVRSGDRRQPRRGEESVDPTGEPVARLGVGVPLRLYSRSAGRTTTYRLGSAPSLDVSIPSRSRR